MSSTATLLQVGTWETEVYLGELRCLGQPCHQRPTNGMPWDQLVAAFAAWGLHSGPCAPMGGNVP